MGKEGIQEGEERGVFDYTRRSEEKDDEVAERGFFEEVRDKINSVRLRDTHL